MIAAHPANSLPTLRARSLLSRLIPNLLPRRLGGSQRVEFLFPTVPCLFRGMPASGHPMAADFNRDVIVVEVQGGDRGSAERRSADDAQSVTAPTKMFAPRLGAWVEQGVLRVRDGIGCRRAVTLVSVAQRATEPQILVHITAALRPWVNVLDFQRGKHQMLWAETIAAAMPRQFAQAAVSISGQTESAHLSPDLSEVRERLRFSTHEPCAAVRVDSSP